MNNKWLDPIYKTLAASELGAGHTSGVVPTRETQDYFGVSEKNETQLLKEIDVEFWSGETHESIKTNVMFYVSDTHHGQIHITGNLMPTYLRYGAQLGDIIVFWKSVDKDTLFKVELIKPGSDRWDQIDASDDFPRRGGFLKLNPPDTN